MRVHSVHIYTTHTQYVCKCRRSRAPTVWLQRGWWMVVSGTIIIIISYCASLGRLPPSTLENTLNGMAGIVVGYFQSWPYIHILNYFMNRPTYMHSWPIWMESCETPALSLSLPTIEKTMFRLMNVNLRLATVVPSYKRVSSQYDATRLWLPRTMSPSREDVMRLWMKEKLTTTRGMITGSHEERKFDNKRNELTRRALFFSITFSMKHKRTRRASQGADRFSGGGT